MIDLSPGFIEMSLIVILYVSVLMLVISGSAILFFFITISTKKERITSLILFGISVYISLMVWDTYSMIKTLGGF